MKANQTASRVLDDALFYLDRIDPAQYKQKIDLLSDSSIGQHTRHFVEFFQCLVNQIEQKGQVINYALRERNQEIENSPAFAAQCIREVQQKLLALKDDTIYQLECSEHLPGDENLRVPTHLSRELMYNIEHTIHHLAIVKIGIHTIEQDLQVPEHFGIAPSTILHRKEKACAQ